MRKWGNHFARTTLILLMLIHLVLPFTPVNHHPEVHIKIASIVFGLSFLAFALISFKNPKAGFVGGLGLLAFLHILSAATGASPIKEGLVFKIIFAAGLISGIFSNTQTTPSGHT